MARKNKLDPETAQFVRAVGIVLKSHRLALKLNTQAAGERIGCSRSAISQVESAKNAISLPMMYAFLRAYKKTPLRLFYDVDALISNV